MYIFLQKLPLESWKFGFYTVKAEDPMAKCQTGPQSPKFGGFFTDFFLFVYHHFTTPCRTRNF